MLILGDSLIELKKIKDNSIDFIFSDPPYFLSNNGISCKNGKMVSVNKGE
jgi:site-specific DNA-methyltransferase (adenine-specific)